MLNTYTRQEVLDYLRDVQNDPIGYTSVVNIFSKVLDVPPTVRDYSQSQFDSFLMARALVKKGKSYAQARTELGIKSAETIGTDRPDDDYTAYESVDGNNQQDALESLYTAAMHVSVQTAQSVGAITRVLTPQLICMQQVKDLAGSIEKSTELMTDFFIGANTARSQKAILTMAAQEMGILPPRQEIRQITATSADSTDSAWES